MALTIDDLFASPDHYLHSFENDAAIFTPMDRASYNRSIFLDRRIVPASDRKMSVPLDMVIKARTALSTNWIFHIAHCGSTLMSRALDHLKSNLVLREPLALRQVAVAPDAARLTLVRAMIGKRYVADLPTIVKANVPVNFLLPEIATAAPDAHAILLYATLRDYLLAVLRSDTHRTWLGHVTTQLAFRIGDLGAASDAQRAAALWLSQMRAFANVAGRMAARSLDAERFFDAPAEMLDAAARHLGVPVTAATIRATVSGPLFSTYSKDPTQAFDNEARIERRMLVERMLAPELDAAAAWLADQPDGASTLASVVAVAL